MLTLADKQSKMQGYQLSVYHLRKTAIEKQLEEQCLPFLLKKMSEMINRLSKELLIICQSIINQLIVEALTILIYLKTTKLNKNPNAL